MINDGVLSALKTRGSDFQIMKQITFSERTVNPAELTLHPYLIEAGFDHRPDGLLLQMLRDTGLYERSIVTPTNEILTQSADLLAALENGVSEVQVYEVDLTALQLKLLVMLKHKYSQKNLLASYKTATFLRDVIDNVEEVNWFDVIDGDFNEKIAAVMHTSASTVKRLLRVGDKAPEKLGLIQEGETSLKAVRDEIKLKELNEKSEEKKSPSAPSVMQKDEKIGGDSSNAPDTDQNAAEQSESTQKKTPVLQDSQTSTGALSFSGGLMTIAGLGTLDVSITSGKAKLVVNGKEVKGVEYTRHLFDG